MPSMESIISSHNKKVLKNENTDTSHSKIECNCRDANLCPLKGKCLRSSIVYQADVITNSSTSTYIGLASNSFKTKTRQKARLYPSIYGNLNLKKSIMILNGALLDKPQLTTTYQKMSVMSISKDSYTYFKSLKPLKQKNGDNEHLQT